MKKLLLILAFLASYLVINSQELEKKDIVDQNSKSQVISTEVSNRSSSVASSGSSITSGSSGRSDIVLPSASPFQLGRSVEGDIQSTVSRTSGKVTFSIPITSLDGNTVGFDVSLAYNGGSVFEQVKNTNKYNSTGIVGVGFGFGVPKIIANHNNTAARDDDSFYLQDGNNTELICVKKTDEYLEFKPKSYAPWKIRYNKGYYDYDFINRIFVKTDYWEIIKEDGIIYHFGNTSDSKSLVSVWGNWIGDSNQTPTGTITSEWNISRIYDQWNNAITFSYEKINGKQNINQTEYFHTEASYVKEIASSRGSKVVFNYGNKLTSEYFEPHIEASEPDAYQEKYEKKYLDNIETYNTNDEKVYTYKLVYDFFNSNDSNKTKRYLTSLIHKNRSGEELPAKKFDYYLTGDFKGGIKEVTYPTGGTVKYNYRKKYLFYNGENKYTTPEPRHPDHYLVASNNMGDYILDLYRSKEKVFFIGNRYEYKVVRKHWTGKSWNVYEYTLPYHLNETIYVEHGTGHRPVYLNQFKIVTGTDYYGFLYFDREKNTARVDLFHLTDNGRTWVQYTKTESSVESKNESPYTEDPVFINGNNFVALGTKRSGELRIYTWNGDSSWNYKYINQNAGEYYYAARNNFILALNEDGNTDMVTGIKHYDNYYFHYLDIEKKWNSRSWSQFATSKINHITKASYFYPSNSMTSFMVDGNSEKFLRWDSNYNLTNIDDVVGSYEDHYPLFNVSRGMFALDNSYSGNYLYKVLHFNGYDWFSDLNIRNKYGDLTSLTYGEDHVVYRNNSTKDVNVTMFNRNTNNWHASKLTKYNGSVSLTTSSSVFGDFYALGNKLYSKHRHPFSSVLTSPYNEKQTLPFNIMFAKSNGNDIAYLSSVDAAHHHHPDWVDSVNSIVLVKDKTNNGVKTININNKFGMTGKDYFGSSQAVIGGNTLNLLSPDDGNSVNRHLHKVIEGGINNSIYDIVVSNLQIEDNNSQTKTISYQFDEYNYLPNQSTIYGKSTIEHLGYRSQGNSYIGKSINYYNRGESDVRLLGVLEKTEVRNRYNDIVKETIFRNTLFQKYYDNSDGIRIDKGRYLRLVTKDDKLYEDEESIDVQEWYTYNNNGLIKIKSTILGGSKENIITNTEYASEFNSFLIEKNILNKPSYIEQKKNNKIIGISETKWKEENGKAFPYIMSAGVASAKVLNEITRVNNFGFTEEENNGKDISSVNLFAYDFKYPVAEIGNVTFVEVESALEVSYNMLQSLTTSELKVELLKLYSKLPNSSISLTFYDRNGNVISEIDSRGEEVSYYYDEFNRLIYKKDSEGNKLEEIEYHFKN